MTDAARADTAAGTVQYLDEGSGSPVLFIHGSPGGCDQGSLMTAFLRSRGHRTIALSRPGYLDTPLTDDNKTPRAQAALAIGLMDTLGIDRFGLMCWSGGGPSAYTLAATAPDRVSALVAIAALSMSYEFASVGEEKMLMGRFGAWLMKEMARHAPKSTIKSLVKEEGDLSKDDREDLVEKIWEDPTKRRWALDFMGTVTGSRKPGFENDIDQFGKLKLDLDVVRAQTLLVHARTDSDVPYEQSEHAASKLPAAEFLTLGEGTHVSAWTAPDASDIQARIAHHLA
ncbi:MAG TPA: alpha/beta hydrolase [Acidimicrobiia bacterium]|jgi:pimeloyl-ACP methyl ester carboxylesterase